MPSLRGLFFAFSWLLPLTSPPIGRDDVAVVATPTAKVQTEPVPSEGDAADDPAIWIHPVDPAKSLVIATDKKGGLHAYDLDGKDKQLVSPGSRPNNVDLVYDFPLGTRSVDLAIASVSGLGGVGVKAWTIDPTRDAPLGELGPGPSFPAFGNTPPYGLCTYKSPKDGSTYVFVTHRDGRVEQYRLDGASGGLKSTLVRSIAVGSQAEGCVADRTRGRFYVAEENVGIWEYGAEADAGSARSLVARVGEHGLAADVEGLAIYYGPGDTGYLIASGQGSNVFVVYERSGTHGYVLTIDPKASSSIDDVAETDGIDVTNERTSSLFPRGFLVVQDGKNSGRQNFKLFAWDEVAGDRLLIDIRASSRARRAESGK